MKKYAVVYKRNGHKRFIGSKQDCENFILHLEDMYSADYTDYEVVEVEIDKP